MVREGGGGRVVDSQSKQRAVSPGARNHNSRGKGGGHGTNLNQIAVDRPIFTLSVAADLLGLHPRTLRIYEEKGLVVPARTEGNRRRYSQNDILRFQVIRQLTRGGVNLEGVRIILDMADELTNLGGDAAGIIERNLLAPPLDEP
jgi:MerR family transcriptional regulator/heat shock protein HspR